LECDESMGQCSMVSDYCQGLLLKEYHSNETRGSQEDGRSWRDFASLVRLGSNSQPKTQVQKTNLGRLFLMRAENDGKLSPGHPPPNRKGKSRNKTEETDHPFKNQTRKGGAPRFRVRHRQPLLRILEVS
jgi:hypothetical protein